MKILETNNYFSFIFLQFHYLNFFVQKNPTKTKYILLETPGPMSFTF